MIVYMQRKKHTKQWRAVNKYVASVVVVHRTGLQCLSYCRLQGHVTALVLSLTVGRGPDPEHLNGFL